MSQELCEWILVMLCCYSGYGPLTHRSVPLDVSTVHSNAAVQLRYKWDFVYFQFKH